MALLLQVIVTGVAAGAVYGLVAIGLSLMYRLTGVVHFAFGELISLAVFVTLAVAAGTGPVTRAGLSAGEFVPALAAGIAVALAAGALTYVGVRPFLRRGSTLGWVGLTVALAFAVRSALAAAFPRPSYVFPDPLPFDRVGDGGVLSLGDGVTLQARTLFVLAVALLLAGLAAWLLHRSDAGRALQAIAAEPMGARAVGLPVDALLIGAFALAGAIAVVAAVVQAPSAPISVDTGSLLGLKGLVAALIAGFGGPLSALGAGVLVGVVEAAVGSIGALGPEYRDVLPLALAVVALVLRRRAHEPAEAR